MPSLPTTLGPLTPAAGAASGLAAFVAMHQAMVWRYLRLLGARPDEADDLLQETFMQWVLRQRDGVVVQHPEAFLRGIARNLLLGSRRRSRREPPTVDWLDAVDRLAAADRDAFADVRIDALRQCLDQLPERSVLALRLHHGEGLGRAEVGGTLGLQDEGIKSLLARSRELLRQCVQRRLQREDER